MVARNAPSRARRPASMLPLRLQCGAGVLEQHARPDVVRITCQDCGQAVEGALVVEQRLIETAAPLRNASSAARRRPVLAKITPSVTYASSAWSPRAMAACAYRSAIRACDGSKIRRYRWRWASRQGDAAGSPCSSDRKSVV